MVVDVTEYLVGMEIGVGDVGGGGGGGGGRCMVGGCVNLLSDNLHQRKVA